LPKFQAKADWRNAETEAELANLEPKIEKLEKQVEKLKELKLAKQKLITLKLSIKSILSNFSLENSENLNSDTLDNFNTLLGYKRLPKNLNTHPEANQNSRFLSSLADHTFLPEKAFAEADNVLRKRTSINYELFRAVVLNGGQASTEQIKNYLLENDVRQPGNGQSFEHVELTDISSRINYLVRKGLVKPDGRGRFVAVPGWVPPGDTE
jgi:hypothetical protein